MSGERDPDELAELRNRHGCDGYDRRAAVGLMRALSRASLALVPAANVPTQEERNDSMSLGHLEPVDVDDLRAALSRLAPYPKEHAAVAALVRRHDRLTLQLGAVSSAIDQACESIATANARLSRKKEDATGEPG